MTSTKRGLIVRCCIAVVYVVLAVCMFITGRSHTLLIDNNGAEDGSYKAIKSMSVTINHLEPSEFMKGDRDKFTIKGQTVKIHVESFDGMLDETYTLKVPMKEDSVLISIPKLAAGIEDAMIPFDLNK